MATRYNITNNGSIYLPINNPDITYTSPSMGADSDRVDVYLEFYDAAGNAVTPTAGQVYIYGLPMGKNWLNATSSPIDAKTVVAGVSTYTPPTMDGLCVQARVRFVGVTGAATASAIVYKR